VKPETEKEKTMSNQLLTTRQLAEVLNVTEATVRAWARAGKIPHTFLAGRDDYRFSRADVLRALSVANETKKEDQE